MFPERAKIKRRNTAALERNFVERTEASQIFREPAALDYRRRLGFSSRATASTCGDHRNWSIGVTAFSV
jgi:hypothetical protein